MNTLYEHYKKTIMDVLVCWEESGIFNLNPKLYDSLSERLHVDLYALMKEKRSFHEICHYGIDFFVTQNSRIFDLIIKYELTKLNLADVIDDSDCTEIVGLYYSGLEESISLLETSNSDLMSIVSQELDMDNVLFDNPDTNPLVLAKSIQLWACICTEDNELQICQFIGLMARLCKYEINSQFEAIYIISILSMISSSKYYDDSVKKLAQEIRDYLFFILKNGKILGININTLRPHITGALRTREDNTTRFQIVYSFGNYDAYNLRFDLPHEGVGYTHVNNISPGGIKSSLFSEEEFRKLISNNPELKECFIKYGERYAIRENARNVIGIDKDKIQQIISSKEHQNILGLTYSEDTINSLTEILAYCYPDKCSRKLDTNGEYAENVFRYNFAMRNVYAAVICFEAGDKKNIERVIDSIGIMANHWGLTNKPQIDSFRKLNELLDTLMERAELND